MKKYPSEDELQLLVCEDVRAEEGNKHTLIGVFSGDTIYINDAPVAHGLMGSLAIFARFLGGEGSFALQLGMTTPSGKQLLKEEIRQAEKVANAAMVIVGKVVPFPLEPGKYTVVVKLDDKSYTRYFSVEFASPQ